MTNSKKTQNPAPLAHRIPAEVTPVILAYSAWLEEQTGYKVDPMSVYIGSQLRGTFQKSEGNQTRLALQAAALAEREQAKILRKLERENAAAAKAAAQAAAQKAAPKAKPAPKVPAKPVRQRTAKPATPVSTPAPKPTRRRPAKAAAPATVPATTEEA